MDVEADAVIESMKDFFATLQANFSAGDLSHRENLKLVMLMDDMDRYVKNQ